MPRLHIDTYPSEEEYKIIQEKAKQLGLSLSKYLIFCGTKTDVNNIKVTLEGKYPSFLSQK